MAGPDGPRSLSRWLVEMDSFTSRYNKVKLCMRFFPNGARMRTLMKSLLTVSAVFSLAAPSSAFALPPQCDDWCWMWTCADTCAVMNRRTTCGAEYPTWCNPTARSEPTDPSASVSADEAREADDASQVCSEEHPEATAEI
ncbi:hypothetical protein ASNO1_62290 [Corallococcus caeni]|nr:hypothetical protein ASNO1_62290 [Corallococcus sp. NO1]